MAIVNNQILTKYIAMLLTMFIRFISYVRFIWYVSSISWAVVHYFMGNVYFSDLRLFFFLEMDFVLSQKSTFYSTDITLKGKNAMVSEKYLSKS